MDQKKNKLASHEACSGCGACKASCPKGAILFREDDEGFPIPEIQTDKCIECGACSKVCPAINQPKMNDILDSYAVQIKDQGILAQSTSGGVFSALSNAIFSLDGVVYGCVWDEKYNAIFKRAEKAEQIEEMHGSKYVWSWAGDQFTQVRTDLQQDKIVLFIGLPCQISGLRSYLGKEYKNLYTVDFLCSGAPSPMVFKRYLKTICSKEEDLPNLHLKFRDKDPYGVGVHISYNGKKGKRKGEHISNPYYYSFYTRMIDRLCCYQCFYGSDKRIADLTMGDYWDVRNYHPNMDIQAGVSALLINTDKGKQLFDEISDTIIAIETKKENIAKANNLSIGKLKAYQKPINRDEFIRTVSQSGWKTAERKYLLNIRRFKRWIKTILPGFILTRLK